MYLTACGQRATAAPHGDFHRPRLDAILYRLAVSITTRGRLCRRLAGLERRSFGLVLLLLGPLRRR